MTDKKPPRGQTKSTPMTFRFTSRFRRLLAKAAQLEQRSNTNMLEKLLFDYCQANGINEDEGAATPSQG